MNLADLATRLRAAGCVYADEEAALLLEAAADDIALDAMAARRAAGEPLEYVLGWAEFCGLRIVVEPGVFVPRRRSGLLVELARAHLAGHATATVLDLCCGSGALAAGLLSRRGGLDVHAVDIDPAAASCARRNLDGRAAVYVGDLFAPLPAELAGYVDLVLANVPYVPTADIAYMPAEARAHEHRVALDGGPDGDDVLVRVAAEAPVWLCRGGALIVEASAGQAPSFAKLFERHGFRAAVRTDDGLGAVAVIGVLQ